MNHQSGGSRIVLNWSTIIQTLVLLLGIIGVAVAMEHRVTQVEIKTESMREAIKELTLQLRATSESLWRVSAILEQIERERDLERRRALRRQ